MVTLGFVGDMFVDRARPNEAFGEVLGALRQLDLRFGNLEGVYSDRVERGPNPSATLIAPSKNIEAFGHAGFEVLSFANNHTLDGGPQVLLDNIEALKSLGAAVIGAGENLLRARAPQLVERGGAKIAFLGYSSVFPIGYEAQRSSAGLAPLRAYTQYHEPVPGFHFPGTAPRIETVPDQGDLDNLREDIARAKSYSDIVIVSVHWGDYLKPYHLTDHELRTARFCIDSGADMVIGHHHHAIRGMEWYRGKPIMYGLGHFVFDWRLQDLSDAFKSTIPAVVTDAYYGIAPRDGWPLLPMHADTRMTMLAWATVEDRTVTAVGFLPCRLRPDGVVVALRPDSEEGAKVVAYFRTCCESQSLNAKIALDEAMQLDGMPTIRVDPVGP